MRIFVPASFVALLVGCTPAPRASSDQVERTRVREKWDGSRSLTRGEEAVFTLSGPLYRRPDRSPKLPKEVVTDRCLRIAHGVPFLASEMVGFTFGLELTTTFESPAVSRTLCSEAFGKGWRLPEREEILALSDTGDLPGGRWFYSGPGSSLGTAELTGGLCYGWECDPIGVELKPFGGKAGVLCVASGSESTGPETPSDEELRACIAQVGRFEEHRPDAVSALPPAEIELVIAARRACDRKDATAWARVIERLEKRRAEVARDSREEEFDGHILDSAIIVLEEARAFAGHVPKTCDELVQSYEADCRNSAEGSNSRCLKLQVTFAKRCAGDPAGVAALEQTLRNAERRYRTLESASRAATLLNRLAVYGLRCQRTLTAAANGDNTARLEALHASLQGPRGPDAVPNPPDPPPEFWTCECAPPDYACGILCATRLEAAPSKP